MQRWHWCMVACLTVGCNSTPDTSLPEPEPESIPAPAQTTAPMNELERLATTDPIAFLERCRDKTAREIQTTRGTLLMHERVEGKVSPPERIRFSFRAQPHAVRMEWIQGIKLARKTLYVTGENEGLLLVQPAGWRSLAGIVRRTPDGEDARSSSRIPITQFGMQFAIESTIRAWKAARQRGDLQVHFTGPKTIPLFGDRPVWELNRGGYETPEEDGICHATFFIDTQTCLQVGIQLRGKNDELIGTYYFRDLEINPTFDTNTFTYEGLKK